MTYYDPQVITNQVVLSATVVWLMNILKKASWFPWISEHTSTINKLIAVIASGLTAIGVGYTYTWSDNNTLVLTITNLSAMSIYTGVKSWIFSYIIQQSGFRLSNTKKEDDSVFVMGAKV